MIRFREPANFWTDYAAELTGVIQYGRFAETLAGAWAIALERPGPLTAPDPDLVRAGYDLRIEDPAILEARYFRPVPGTESRSALDLQIWILRAIREVDQWADSALMLYGTTARGIVARRDFEVWLTTRLRSQSKDPLEALCTLEASLARPVPEAFAAMPEGAGKYWAANGQRYDRIGWPSPLAGSTPPGVSSRPPGQGPGSPSGPPPGITPFSAPALPTIPARPRRVPNIRPPSRRRRGRARRVPAG